MRAAEDSVVARCVDCVLHAVDILSRWSELGRARSVMVVAAQARFAASVM